MAEIKAFRALRFTDSSGSIKDNVCPPYDIISPEEREALVSKSKNNLVRLELPVGENKYSDAGALLEKWLSEEILAEDSKDCLYIYEEEFTVSGKTYRNRGMVCLVKLHEFSEGIVLPHEYTLSKAKDDRFNLMSETFCNFSQVYSLYIDGERNITPKMDELATGAPVNEFTDESGVTHRLWISSDEKKNAAVCAAFADKQLYIADGHHRYETALRFKKKLADTGRLTKDHKGNYMMMFLADLESSGLVILPTHRLVQNIEGFSEEKVLDGIKEKFTVSKVTGDIEAQLLEFSDENAFGFVTASNAYICRLSDKDAMKRALGEKCAAYRELDVSVLHTLVLDSVLGINAENMAAQKNLTYTRSFEEAVERVKNGEYQAAFILNSTKIGQIKDVALAGEKMPQKSTYFYPKLITGLVMNKICDK